MHLYYTEASSLVPLLTALSANVRVYRLALAAEHS